MRLLRLLAVLVFGGGGIFGVGLLTHSPSGAAAAKAADCTSIQTAVTGLLPATSTTTTTFHTGIAPWSFDPAGGPTRQQWLTAVHLIINNPQCFDPTLVATAQAGLDDLSH